LKRDDDATTLQALSRTFLRGLAIVLPALLTGYVLWWLAATAEGTLGPALSRLLPTDRYVRGLGILAGVGLILAVGAITRLWLARKLLELLEGVIGRIPLVKTIYGSIKDLMGFFSGDAKGELEQVVLVRFETPPMRMLGFVTREDLTSTSPELDAEQIAVYLPMSYQIGGFTVIVPRSMVAPVAMTVEEAMRFAMTAGVSGKPAAPPHPPPSASPAH
jgi:uncharacterized membrane protein